jgi:hypothetical protein
LVVMPADSRVVVFISDTKVFPLFSVPRVQA